MRVLTSHLGSRRGRWSRGAPTLILTGLLVGGGSAVTTAIVEAATPGWCPTSLRPADTWNTFTVDIDFLRQRVTRAGDPVGAPAPAAKYRLERSSRSGRWKTVLTVLSIGRPPVYALTGAILAPRPFPVARLEDDEDGSPVRAYDANGTLLSPTRLGSTTAATTVLRADGQQWLGAFVAAPSKKTQRQQAFEKAYGKATKAGTLNRYVRLEADGSEEVLVDPKVVVPVEANTTRSGQRVSHRTFQYGPAPDSSLVRTVMHADTVASASTGERTLVDTAFSNVCLELRR